MVSSKEAVRIIVEEINRAQNQGGRSGGDGTSAEVDEDVHSSRKEKD